MRRARTLLVTGIWMAILPFLGFPHAWKNVLFTFTGLFVIVLGYGMYQVHRKLEQREASFDNFRENSPFAEERLGDDMAK